MPLSASENRLLSALQNYLTAVSAQKGPIPPDLVPHCIELEKLHRELATEISPRLDHFLESKSYRKAHDLLAAASELANTKKSAQAWAS